MRPPTNDERAATQRRIADAIRAAITADGERDPDVFGGDLASLAGMIRSDTPPLSMRILAALCTDDALWDAAAQVRQAIVLERAAPQLPDGTPGPELLKKRFRFGGGK